MEPRVLAIVSYNRAGFVERAVRCLCDQTYRNLEIYVLDLGTDETGAVVRGKFGGRVTVLPCSSISAGRNEAIRTSHADFVALASSDTFAAPDRIERQVCALEAYPRAALCYTDVGFCDEGGLPAPDPGRGPSRKDRPSGAVFRRLLIGGNMVLGATVLLRREALDDRGPFDEQPGISQDYDLWVRIARAHHFVYVPAPLVVYRATTFAMPEDGSVAALKRHLRAFDKHMADAIARGIARRELHARRCEILADLGYQLLLLGNDAAARRALAEALARCPTDLRLARLLGQSLLPPRLRRIVRGVWNRLRLVRLRA